MKIVVVTSLFAGMSCWSVQAFDAQDYWNHHCAICHGKDGKGQTLMGRRLSLKDYTKPDVQHALTDAKAVETIKKGIKENGKEKMKPFGDKLSEDEIQAMLKYLRHFKKT